MTLRFPLRLAAVIGVLLAAFVLIAAPSSGHPGGTDPTGGHECRVGDADAGLCARGTYHRHGPNGSMVIVPEPTREEKRAARAAAGGGTAASQANANVAPTTAVAGAPAAPLAPAPAPGTTPGLAATGPSSVVVALGLTGLLLLALGAGAISSARLVPAPALVEWSRPFSG